MSGGDNLLKLVEAEEPEEQDYLLQEQVGFILRKAHQRHVSIFTGRIGDLTPPQFAALAMLCEVGETSQNQLGQMIAMDAATAKGVVDRLKARAYVAVRPDPADKRRLLVALTDAGREACDTLIPLAQLITADTLAPLSAKEGETLLRLLSRIA